MTQEEANKCYDDLVAEKEQIQKALVESNLEVERLQGHNRQWREKVEAQDYNIRKLKERIERYERIIDHWIEVEQ